MEQNSIVKTIFSFFIKAIKAIFILPVALGMFMAAVGLTYELVLQLFAFAAEGVYPMPYILSQLCTVGMAVFFGLLISKLLFTRMLEKLPARTLFIMLMVISFGAAGFDVMDENATEDFENMYYPPYISQWQTQTITEEINCDYSYDYIPLSGSFTVLSNGFRKSECVEFVTTPSLTDSFNVQIMYKGKQAEIYLHQNEYQMEENGLYQFDINIWPQDYDYTLSAQDRAYMYKHGINLEYSEPLAVEKIIIYTAYPEKFDISEMWFQ